MNWKRKVLQCVVWLLILQGISSLWTFTDVAMFGESQKSAVDAIAAMFMTDWIHSKVFGRTNQ